MIQKKTLIRLLKNVFIIVALFILFYVLIYLFPMTYIFPSADFSSAVAKIWFMSDTGFGKTPYWYSGYYPFLQYPPISSLLGAIIYKLIGNLGASLYLEIIGFMILGFLGFLLLKKIRNWNLKETIIYYLIFFVNPLTLPWFFKIGRTNELLGWILAIFSCYFIYKYKEKDLDKKFFLIIIPLTLIIISHPVAFFLLMFPFLGLFISKLKKPKELLKIISVIVISLILTSFWWIPFFTVRVVESQYVEVFGEVLNKIKLERFYSIIFPLTAGLFLLTKRISKYMSLPIILISVLYITDAYMLFPLLNTIYARSYAIMILLLLILEFKKEDLNKIWVLLLIGIIALAGFAVYNNPGNHYDPYAITKGDYKDYTDLFARNSPDSFIIISKYSYHPETLYSYAPVYFKYTTPLGWFYQEETKDLNLLKENLNSENCSILSNSINKLNVNLIFSDKCDIISNCIINFSKIDSQGEVCLYQKAKEK